VQLLRADRPEVFVTAAWGLRKLAVRDTLAGALRYVGDELRRQLKGNNLPGRKGIRTDWIDHQLSQLNQFLGRQKYGPADPVLRQFIPKRPAPVINESRAAAIWALGMIHQGKEVPDLVTSLEGRLNDTVGMP